MRILDSDYLVIGSGLAGLMTALRLARQDARVVLAAKKTPDESKAQWDYYKQLSTIPGSSAFESVEESGCKIGG